MGTLLNSTLSCICSPSKAAHDKTCQMISKIGLAYLLLSALLFAVASILRRILHPRGHPAHCWIRQCLHSSQSPLLGPPTPRTLASWTARALYSSNTAGLGRYYTRDTSF